MIATSIANPSPAAKAALDRIISDERRRNSTRVTAMRLVATGVGSALFLLVPSDDFNIRVSRDGAFLYFAVAAIIATVVYLFPRVSMASAYAIAFVDVPLLSAVHHLQLEGLGDHRYLNVPANMVMMSALIVFSSLSMSWPVITATAVTALSSMMLMLYRCDYPPLPMMLTGIAVPAMATVSCLLVARIRTLVTESRKRDLLGKYILGPRLGSGGMAEVFLATYSPEGGFERKVAVKRILPSFAQDPTAVALFRREAELGATLAHPNLVHVLDFGSDGETFFLAMELVEGCTLANVYDATKSAGRPLEPTAIAYIAWCLAEALDHLHEHVSPTGAPLHLVHRDINPPNVLVSVAGDVKLADFGIVRDLSAPNLTEFGVMRGKLAYAAPEQALGDRFDGRADLFALGITLWELSAGRRLFRADGDVSLLRAVLDEPIIPLGPLRRDLPPSFERIVMDLLERDLDRRTASARRLLQQLSALGTDVLDVREGRRLLAAWVEAGRVEKARVPPLASPSVAATAAETVTRTVGPT